MTYTPDQITAWIFGAIATLAAGFERYRSSRAANKKLDDDTTLSEARMWKEKAVTMATMANDYKALYEAERADHSKTREFWHNKASEHQVSLSTCQEKILELQARPDLTDISKHIAAQSAVSTETLKELKELIEHITTTHK